MAINPLVANLLSRQQAMRSTQPYSPEMYNPYLLPSNQSWEVFAPLSPSSGVYSYVDPNAVAQEEEAAVEPLYVKPQDNGGEGANDTIAGYTPYSKQALTKVAEWLGALDAEDLKDVEGDTLAEKARNRMLTENPFSIKSPSILGLVAGVAKSLADDVGSRRAAITREDEMRKNPLIDRAYNFSQNPSTNSFVAGTPSTQITSFSQDDYGNPVVDSWEHVGASGTQYSDSDLSSDGQNWTDVEAVDDVMEAIEAEFDSLPTTTGAGQQSTPQTDNGGGDDGGYSGTGSAEAQDNYGGGWDDGYWYKGGFVKYKQTGGSMNPLLQGAAGMAPGAPVVPPEATIGPQPTLPTPTPAMPPQGAPMPLARKSFADKVAEARQALQAGRPAQRPPMHQMPDGSMMPGRQHMGVDGQGDTGVIGLKQPYMSTEELAPDIGPDIIDAEVPEGSFILNAEGYGEDTPRVEEILRRYEGGAV